MRDGRLYAQEMYERCAEELKQLGYQCADKIEFGFEKFKNHNMYGLTKEVWNEKGKTESYAILFSIMFLDERVPEVGFRAVMFHELLHTVNNFMDDDHSGRWLSAAKRIEEKYPELFIVNSTRKSLKIPEQVFLDVYYHGSPKYVIQCNQCGRLVYRARETNLMKRPGDYRCGDCGGMYGPVKLYSKQEKSATQ